MSVTRKVGRVSLWVAINGAMAWVAWLGAVDGEAWAANVIRFALWVTLALNLLAVSGAQDPKVARTLLATGPSVPNTVSLLFDFGLAMLLASQGWFGYATIAVLQGLFQIAAYSRAADTIAEEEP